MINLNEITNRKYEGKEPISFEYVLKNLDGQNGTPQELRIWFEKVNPIEYNIPNNPPTYRVFTIINSVVYEKIFAMPKRNMELIMVVATGLNLLRLTIQEEIAYKEMVSYSIADIIKDM